MSKFGYLVLLLLISFSESYRILGVFNAAAPSHYILGSALMRGLAEKGHDVTVISPFGEKNIPKAWKYRDIVLTGFVEEWNSFTKDMMQMKDSGVFVMTMMMNFMAKEVSEKTLSHPNVQKLLNSQDEQFDVIIIEQFMNDALKGFSYHFNCPYILFSTIGANSMVNSYVANPSNPSYIPEIILGLPPKMNFWERMQNFLFATFAYINLNLILHPQQNSIMKKYFQGAPHLDDLLYNTSLVLLNSHVSSNQPVPQVPNMINIGGFHLNPSKKLPADLKQFLDNSPNGVIYFSLGSNMKSIFLPENVRNIFLNVFSKMKENILWKFEDNDLPGKPPNVKIAKWLPQQDILAHPNVKIFITHGGLLSTTETIYHGVPILAIPFFADQKFNAIQAENNAIGLKLDFDDISEKMLHRKLTTLLLNPKFHQNAKLRSQVMRDNQNKPMDTANFWVEYVVRHKGAPHFKSAALNLSWYQYLLLDVILVVALGIIIVNIILFIIIKKIVKHLRKSKAKPKSSPKKKNK